MAGRSCVDFTKEEEKKIWDDVNEVHDVIVNALGVPEAQSGDNSWQQLMEGVDEWGIEYFFDKFWVTIRPIYQYEKALAEPESKIKPLSVKKINIDEVPAQFPEKNTERLKKALDAIKKNFKIKEVDVSTYVHKVPAVDKHVWKIWPFWKVLVRESEAYEHKIIDVSILLEKTIINIE